LFHVPNICRFGCPQTHDFGHLRDEARVKTPHDSIVGHTEL